MWHLKFERLTPAVAEAMAGSLRQTMAGMPAIALVVPLGGTTALRAAKAGGTEGNQTPDLFIANEALYQLSYSPFYPAWRVEFLRCSGGGVNSIFYSPTEVWAAHEQKNHSINWVGISFALAGVAYPNSKQDLSR